MKRSEMLLILEAVLEELYGDVYNNIDSDIGAKSILAEIERAGMLPPKIIISSKHDSWIDDNEPWEVSRTLHEWESEHE